MALMQPNLSELDTDILALASAGFEKRLVQRTPERGLHYEIPDSDGSRWFVVTPRRVTLAANGQIEQMLAADIILGLRLQGETGHGSQRSRLVLHYETGARSGAAVVAPDSGLVQTLGQSFYRSLEVCLVEQPCAFDMDTGFALDAELTTVKRLTDIRNLILQLEQGPEECLMAHG